MLDIINKTNQSTIDKINTVLLTNIEKINKVIAEEVIHPIYLTGVSSFKISPNGSFALATGLGASNDERRRLYLYDKANDNWSWSHEAGFHGRIHDVAMNDNYSSDHSVHQGREDKFFTRANTSGLTRVWNHFENNNFRLAFWDPEEEEIILRDEWYNYPGSAWHNQGVYPTTISISDDGKKSINNGSSTFNYHKIEDGIRTRLYGWLSYRNAWASSGTGVGMGTKVINDGVLGWNRNSNLISNSSYVWQGVGIYFAKELKPFSGGVIYEPNRYEWIQVTPLSYYDEVNNIDEVYNFNGRHTNNPAALFRGVDISPNGKYIVGIRLDGNFQNKHIIFENDFLNKFNQKEEELENGFEWPFKYVIGNLDATITIDNSEFFRSVKVNDAGLAFFYNCEAESHKDVLRIIDLNNINADPVDIKMTPNGGRLELFETNGTDVLIKEQNGYTYYSGKQLEV